jgi:hypothetical protein
MSNVRASPGHSWFVFTVFLGMSTAIAESDKGGTTERANVLPLVVVRFHMICVVDSNISKLYHDNGQASYNHNYVLR